MNTNRLFLTLALNIFCLNASPLNTEHKFFFNSVPKNVGVYIEGKKECTTPCTINYETKKKSIKIRFAKQGYVAFSEEIDLESKEIISQKEDNKISHMAKTVDRTERDIYPHERDSFLVKLSKKREIPKEVLEKRKKLKPAKSKKYTAAKAPKKKPPTKKSIVVLKKPARPKTTPKTVQKPPSKIEVIGKAKIKEEDKERFVKIDENTPAPSATPNTKDQNDQIEQKAEQKTEQKAEQKIEQSVKIATKPPAETLEKEMAKMEKTQRQTKAKMPPDFENLR